jgi:hypothetical protein
MELMCHQVHYRDRVPVREAFEQTWIQELESAIQNRLDREMVMVPVTELHEYLLTPFFEENVQEIEESKFRCGVCSKLFRGADFVKKHLFNKHQEEVDKELDRMESYEMFRNFISDKDRPRAVEISSSSVSRPSRRHSDRPGPRDRGREYSRSSDGFPGHPRTIPPPPRLGDVRRLSASNAEIPVYARNRELLSYKDFDSPPVVLDFENRKTNKNDAPASVDYGF